MHTLKVILLLALTLTLMRAVSWAFAWPLTRWRPERTGAVHVASNTAGLMVFLGFLRWNRLPGEFLDYSAAMFGLAVYAFFAFIDLMWRSRSSRSASPKP